MRREHLIRALAVGVVVVVCSGTTARAASNYEKKILSAAREAPHQWVLQLEALLRSKETSPHGQRAARSLLRQGKPRFEQLQREAAEARLKQALRLYLDGSRALGGLGRLVEPRWPVGSAHLRRGADPAAVLSVAVHKIAEATRLARSIVQSGEGYYFTAKHRGTARAIITAGAIKRAELGLLALGPDLQRWRTATARGESAAGLERIGKRLVERARQVRQSIQVAAASQGKGRVVERIVSKSLAQVDQILEEVGTTQARAASREADVLSRTFADDPLKNGDRAWRLLTLAVSELQDAKTGPASDKQQRRAATLAGTAYVKLLEYYVASPHGGADRRNLAALEGLLRFDRAYNAHVFGTWYRRNRVLLEPELVALIEKTRGRAWEVLTEDSDITAPRLSRQRLVAMESAASYLLENEARFRYDTNTPYPTVNRAVGAYKEELTACLTRIEGGERTPALVQRMNDLIELQDRSGLGLETFFSWYRANQKEIAEARAYYWDVERHRIAAAEAFARLLGKKTTIQAAGAAQGASGSGTLTSARRFLFGK